MNIGIGISLANYRPVPTVPLDPDAAIAALFGSGEVGAWYDPSDLSTLYQDAKGTTPVTGTGQPVGLMLDKSKGLTLGSELVTNGTFDSNGAGWTVAYGTFDFSGGTADAVGSSAVYQNTSSVISGKTYEIAFDITRYVSGSVSVFFNSNASGGSTGAFTGVGSYSAKIQCVATTTTIYVQIGGVSPDAAVDNISIRELPGNHATQSTSAARPVLQQSGATPVLGSQLVSNGSFDADVSGWGDLGAWTVGSIAWNAGQAEVTVSSYQGAAQQFATGALNKWYKITFDVVSSGNVGRVYVGNATNISAAASLNVAGLAAGSYEYTFRSTYDTIAVGLSSTSGTGTVIYDNISVQEVTAWTGGQYYLDFDGVDDWMASASGIASGIDLYTSSALRIDGAGGGASSHPITSPGLQGSTASFCALIRNDVVKRSIGFYRLGSTTSFYTPNLENSYTHGVPFIIRVWHESDTLYAETNEASAGSVAAVETTPVTTRQIMLVGSNTSFLAAKYFGGVLVADRVLTAQEKTDLESYLAAKSGVTL